LGAELQLYEEVLRLAWTRRGFASRLNEWLFDPSFSDAHLLLAGFVTMEYDSDTSI